MKILPSADPHREAGLGLECKNSTINLMFRAAAPTLVSGTFYLVGKGWCLLLEPVLPLPKQESQEDRFFGGWKD